MKRKIIEELVIVFWLFVLGSIAGYCIEMMISLVEKGHFESRQGMLYGPFTQVYGIGIVLYYIILRNVKTKNLQADLIKIVPHRSSPGGGGE